MQTRFANDDLRTAFAAKPVPPALRADGSTDALASAKGRSIIYNRRVA
jgi:hypothetical protein